MKARWMRSPPLWLACPASQADTPMDYMHTAGPAADPVTALGWGVTIISLLVCLIIAGLLLGALLRQRPRLREEGGRLPVERGSGGLDWVYIGTGISTAVLFGAVIWTFATFAAVAERNPAEPGLTLAVTGHQWWWEIRYGGGDAAPGGFGTANEIHIPVGQPVRLRLDSADVIHSFWVPKLAGKTDAIPGQTNLAWLQADAPGIYLGQCAEYCGIQHAHMEVLVVADSPADFKAWQDRQRAANPPEPTAQAGLAAFTGQCGVCHQVRGTAARGIVGPDLTHVMSRQHIGGGVLPNSVGNLGGWVANAQAQKPGCAMPAMALSGTELQAVLGYLQTLR